MTNKIEELNKELEELQTKIKEVQNKIDDVKQEKAWPPKYGDTYRIIFSDGTVGTTTWLNDQMDNRRMSAGNIFQTKEEAEFEVERRKLITELKKFAMKRIDWRANRYDGEMYYIYLSGKNEIKINRARGFVHSTLYFESPEKAKEAIATIGEDRVKKYYFEVDEE